MAKYLDKWKTDFPASVGNVTRPTDGIDNTLDFNTDGFPQRISSDPVHYKLENDMASQLFSNDARLKEAIDANKEAGDDGLASHNKNAQAHANGIAGNAATATKLKDARTITVNLGSTTGASFNGTANITPGVSGTLPVANGGTGATSLANVNVGSATKLQTARNINVTGDYLTGTAASFNGSSDASIKLALNLLSMANAGKYFINRASTTSDFNEYRTSGIYSFGPQTKNGWGTSDYGSVVVINNNYNQEINNGAWIWQIAYTTTGKIYMRYTTNPSVKTSWNIGWKLISTNGMINSDTLPIATTSTLGGVKVGSNLSIVNGVLSALAASQTVAGYMSAADKKKLDGIATGANAYTLPTASASTLGGVKVGSGLNILNGILNADAQSLGVVAGNVSNANAWWVKLGGTIPLIIQGINYTNTASNSKSEATISFPIAMTKNTLLAIRTTRGESEDGWTDRNRDILSWTTNSLKIRLDSASHCSAYIVLVIGY